MPKDTAFNGETTPRHTILCSDSQCLPPGDPKILCAKHEYPITGKSFIVGLHPLDLRRAIIRVDPSHGFQSMANNDSLNHLNVTIDVGRVKNKNKNPVAEKAVRELEEELIRQEPGGRPVSAVGLALATARLNSRLRLPGLSSRELWTQRNQFTQEP